IIPSFWKDWIASRRYQEEAVQRLHLWQLEVPAENDIKKIHIGYGNSAEVILEMADAINSNLIVLGAKMSTNTGRYKTGTTVEAVVRHAKVPVWICKYEHISKIICGIDGSPSSEQALQFALDLCHHFSASLCIISTIPYADDYNALGLTENEIKEHEEEFKAQQINKLNEFLDRFDFSNVVMQKCFQRGNPANVILDMAEDFNFDLIVVGAKGHSMLQHVLIGSTADKILRYTPCSLLVVR
ncbi:MAG TPA: universal stress protein, partial [Gammaproteobacteria bacterium]|nr:universal stress protein [Gammaproteobacteria bacterium]